MAVTYNMKGTSYPSLQIGKQGSTIFQGSSAPTSANSGDIWLSSSGLSSYDGSTWQTYIEEGSINKANGVIGLDSLRQASCVGLEGTSYLKSSLLEGDVLEAYSATEITIASSAVFSDSVSFTIIPTSVTPTAGDSSTNVATTAFVSKEVSTSLEGYLLSSTAETTYATQTSLSNYLKTADAETTYLPLVGGKLTGDLLISEESTSLSQLHLMNGDIESWIINRDASNQFNIARYDSTGKYVDEPLSISNSNGIVSFLYSPTAPTPSAGDSSTKVATTEFVSNAITNGDVLRGPEVIYGSSTESTSGGLSLDYYISGPPTTGSATTDAQILITNGTAGTANQATFELLAENIILSGSYLTTTSPTIEIGNQTDTKNPITENINFYLNGSTVADANINVSGGTGGTENGAVIQLNASTLDCSSTISNMTVPDVASSSDSSTKAANTAFVQSVVSKYLPLDGGSLTGNLNLDYSGAVLNLGSSTVSTSTPHLYFYSSGSGYASSDAYISCSGGSSTNNNGTLNICGGIINLTGGTVTAPTPSAGDSSTNVATTAFVQNAKGSMNTYTVATLPSTASAGAIAFATDGLKPGEVTGSGTGTPCFYDGTSWLSFGSFQAVES